MRVKPTLTCLLITALMLLALGAPARAQSGLEALSVTRLLVPSADPVPEGKVELSTVWRMGWYGHQFDHRWVAQDPGLLSTRAVLGLRAIVGIVDTPYFGMEFGSVLPVVFTWSKNRVTDENLSAVGFGDIPLGLKMRVFATREWSLALGLGATVPTGDQSASLSDGNSRITTGVLLSGNPVAGFALDWATTVTGTVGVTDAEKETVATWGLSSSVALAWVSRRGFFRVVTPAVELGWAMERVPRATHSYVHKLLMNIGLTFQLSKRVLMVQGVQVDLAGQNSRRGAAWFMSTNFLI